jgi:hypothetical protein
VRLKRRSGNSALPASSGGSEVCGGILPPEGGLEAPGAGVDAPGAGVDAPGAGVDAPGAGVEAPGVGVETPGLGLPEGAPPVGALLPTVPGLVASLTPLSFCPPQAAITPVLIAISNSRRKRVS